MSGWGTQEMAAALPEITDAAPGEGEVSKNPREHGWVEKSSYDYETYNKSNKEIRDGAIITTDGAEGPNPHAMGVETGGWASNAAIYEWDDEYGDVGPEFPALEAQLFGGEFRMQTGVKFDK